MGGGSHCGSQMGSTRRDLQHPPTLSSCGVTHRYWNHPLANHPLALAASLS